MKIWIIGNSVSRLYLRSLPPLSTQRSPHQPRWETMKKTRSRRSLPPRRPLLRDGPPRALAVRTAATCRASMAEKKPKTNMSTFEVVALTSAASVATLIISRLRCIMKPCSPDGDKCISGCSDQPLRKDEHELDISHYELNGRDIIIMTAKE